MSNSLRPHESQHTRPPVQFCPTLRSPTVCSTPGLPIHHQLLELTQTHALSQWCHPTISSSVVPFSFHLQSFPASGSFPVSHFFTSGGQIIRVSASRSILPMNIQDWFPLELTGLISLQSKGLYSQVLSILKSLLQHCRLVINSLYYLEIIFLCINFENVYQEWILNFIRCFLRSNEQPRQHLKSRDVTLPTKIHLVIAMVLPVIMYGCESWTIKKRLSAKELMLLNCGVGEDSWQSLGQQGDPTSPS